MNDKRLGKEKKTDKKSNAPQPVEVAHEEMEELKRDMRTAKLSAWAQENQQKLIAAVIAFFVLVAGVSLWKERIASQRTSAAILYHQAMGAADSSQKTSLLKTIVQDYDNTAYSVLSLMQLARLDAVKAEQHLQMLLAQRGLTVEVETQARLDLAELYLDRGDADKANALLNEPAGKHYEQLRYYLLAQAAATSSEKRDYYNKALAAESHDTDLDKAVARRLAELGTAAE